MGQNNGESHLTHGPESGGKVSPGRDPRERVISVAYVTLHDADAVQPQAASDAAAVAWFAYDALPPLAFDHAEIIACAYERVRGRLSEGVLGL